MSNELTLTPWSLIPGKPAGLDTLPSDVSALQAAVALLNSTTAKLTGGNTFSGNQTFANPSGVGPSPYLSAVNSFSEATLELRNSQTNGYTKLNLGSLVASGNISAGGLTASGNINTGFLNATPEQSNIAGTKLGSTGNGPWIRGSGASYTISRTNSQASASLYFYSFGNETVQVYGRLGIGGIVQSPQSFLTAASNTLSLWQSDGTTPGSLNLANLTASGTITATNFVGSLVGASGLGYVLGNAGVVIASDKVFASSGTTNPQSAATVTLSRANDTTWQVGTGGTANANGGVNASFFGASNSVYLGPAATVRLADYVNIQSGGNWGLVDVAPMTGSQSGLMRIYNGLLDLTNYERLEIGQQTAGDAVIRTAAGGTGTRRNLALDAPTVNMGATGTRGLKVGKAVTITNFVEVNPDKVTVQGDPFKMWGYQSSFMSLAQSHAVGVSGAGLDSPGLKFVGGWNAGGTEYSPTASILFKPSSTDKGSLCFSSGYEGLRITTTENRPAVLQVNSPTISTAMVNITTSWTGKKGLLVQGVASQTENLIEAQDNTGAALFAVSPTQVRITHATNPELLLSGPGGGGTSAGNIKFTGNNGAWNYARINGESVTGGAFGTGALSFYVVNSGVEQLGMRVTGPGQASFGDLTGSAVAQVAMRNYSYGGITYPLVLDNHSNSTDGVGIQFMGTGTSGTALTTGKIDVRKTALTSTTTTADLVISLPNASATVAEVFRIKGNGDINAIGTVTIGGTTAPNIDIRNASNELYAQFNGTARSFYAGGDAFAVLTSDGSSRLYNNGRLGWNTGAIASSGTCDIALGRAGVNTVGVYNNVTGSTLASLNAKAGGTRFVNSLQGTHGIEFHEVHLDGRTQLRHSNQTSNYIQFSPAGPGTINYWTLALCTLGADTRWGTGGSGNSNNLVMYQSSSSGSDATVGLYAERYADVTTNGQPKLALYAKRISFNTKSADTGVLTGIVEQAYVDTNGLTVTNKITGGGNVEFMPPPSVTPSVTNGSLTFEATSNTSLTIKYRGSDGVVRSSVLALS